MAPPIDPDAAALTGYSSPNTGQDGSTLGDLPVDPELLRLRGFSDKDQDIHRMISWTTRKDYPLLVGISLPIPDQSFDRAHEAQLWEETDENWIIEDDHAAKAFLWLSNRFRSRSLHQLTPTGFPDSVSDLDVSTWRDGKAGYILFVPSDAIMTKLSVSETRILLEYELGYMKVGVPNAYTLQMIYDDFTYLNEAWDIYPAQACRRLMDGTIVHNCTTDYRTGQLLRAAAETIDPPVSIIEDRGRGSEINSVADQGKLLQYL
jgi:hypothetical protein